MAKFDDESAEYVLSKSLMRHLESECEKIEHAQDLLNICATFQEFVPFFVILYQDEVFQLIS